MQIEITLQPKQKEAFVKSMEVPILFFGGARGGGKSYLVRAREVYRRLKFPGTKGLIVRKTYPELLSNHIRMFWKEYPATVQWFHKGEKAIYWPNGSITEFSYLKSTDDVYTYQGREYEDISIDEITQHEEDVFKILRASNRTTNPEIKPTMILTGNPGGIGHGWCKRIFVDRNFHEDEDPKEYAFIQSKVRDNQALMEADPDYIKRLQALPTDRRRAWLDGDWDVFSGQVFSEFRRDTHVINPLTPNSAFKHYFGIDWGYSEKAAFACYASAVISMKAEDGQVFNRIITYQEWYGNQKYPDEWAGLIFKGARNRKFIRGYTDPSMHNPQSDGSVSIARLFDRLWTRKNRGTRWCFLDKGSRNRVARVATVHNWLSMAPDGLPYWLMTSDCHNLITTLPMLVYDEHRVDDIDCFVAGTKIETINGYKNIEDIVLGELVKTPVGYRRVIKNNISGFAPTMEVKLNNGKKLRGTLNHKFFVKGKGLIKLKNLKKCDILIDNTICLSVKPLFTKGLNTVAMRIEDIMSQMERILQGGMLPFIAKFTLTILVKFLKAITSIIKTMITMTIVPRIWLYLASKTMLGITSMLEKIFKKKSRLGEKVRQARKLSEKMLIKCLNEDQKDGSRALIVKRLLSQKIVQKDTVLSNARGKMHSLKNVLFATKNRLGKIQPVHISAVGNYEEKTKVFNLTVEDAHLYYANGVLVTNTSQEDHAYDGVGYFLSQIKWISATVGSFGGKRSPSHTMKAIPAMPMSDEGQPLSIDIDAFASPGRRHRDWKSV